MSQAKTRKVTWTYIMRSKAFAQGVEDRRTGKPIGRDYDAMPQRQQWLYEFGRQFGAYAPASMAFKTGIKVSPAAVKVAQEMNA